METVVFGFFYGTLAGHYLWFKKEVIYESAKTAVTSVAKRVWVAGKQAVLRRLNRRKIKEASKTKKMRFDEITEEVNETKIQKKIGSDVIFSYKLPKEKKIRKAESKPANIQKKIRDYEDWVLNNKQLRTMKDSPILIEQQLKRIHSHKFTDQAMVLVDKENEENEDEMVAKIINDFKVSIGRAFTYTYNPIVEKGDYDQYKSPLDLEVINLTSSSI